MVISTINASSLGLFGSPASSIKTFITGLLTYAVYTLSKRKSSNIEDLYKINEIKPNEHIFVFDVHGVLFKLSIIEIIKITLKDPSSLWIITMMMRPMLCVNLFRSQLNGGVAEEIIFNVAKEKPNLAWFVPKAFKLINAQTPIKRTIEVVRKLKEKGYKLYILSNIGEKSLNHIKANHKEVFGLFDGIYTSTDKDGYIKKPSPEIYKKYLDKFGQNPCQLIFVDDKQSNLNVARDLNFNTIHFTSSKKLFKLLSNKRAF